MATDGSPNGSKGSTRQPPPRWLSRFSKAKALGSGVFEYKIDFGPGYRIYFGKDADRLVILIGGGTKKRQQQDIAAAQACWAAYKRRKKQEIQ